MLAARYKLFFSLAFSRITKVQQKKEGTLLVKIRYLNKRDRRKNETERGKFKKKYFEREKLLSRLLEA
jgi:hypothetical protein